ncbi:MAG: hypothetical protein NT094_02890 [Candidatus Staskawiczbacteria bacterium]|nr:hypothetical protein [Candidatus Staskawiczbacteria bacterium]
MPQQNQEITYNLFISAVLSSALIATVVGFILGWIKEYFQKRNEKEQERFEKLYGSLTYHLLAMKVLKINRTELLKEISEEPTPPDTGGILSKFSEVNPLIDKWHEHNNKLKDMLEKNAGYIKKCHLKLIEDFLDGCVKREITDGGKSRHTTEERINKMLDAIEALQAELIK